MLRRWFGSKSENMNVQQNNASDNRAALFAAHTDERGYAAPRASFCYAALRVEACYHISIE